MSQIQFQLFLQLQLMRIKEALSSPIPLHSTGPKRPDLDRQESEAKR